MSKYICIILLFLSCSSTDSPLKNTPKLVKQGHRDLYENGAFKVPGTTIKLIPEGPSATELGLQMIGPGAKASFLDAVYGAKESMVIVASGTKSSIRLAKGANTQGTKLARKIRSNMKKGSTWVMNKSIATSIGILGSTLKTSSQIFKQTQQSGDQIFSKHIKGADRSKKRLDKISKKTFQGGVKEASKLSRNGVKNLTKNMKNEYKDFIAAYIKFPQKSKKNINDIEFKKSLHKYVKDFKSTNKFRKKYSHKLSGKISKTISQSKEERDNSFTKAKESLNDSSSWGHSLAVLKAIGHVIDGIFYRSLIKPTIKLASYSTGYLLINGVAFPIMTIAKPVARTNILAVKILWNSAEIGYDLTAPTVIAALSAAFEMLRFGATEIAAAGTATSATTGAAIIKGTNFASDAAFRSWAYVEKGTIKYIGAPLAYATSVATLATTGVVIGAGGAATSVALRTTGELSSLGTRSVSLVTSASIATIGTTGSLAAGTLLTAYEVSKGIIVPTGQILGGGLVLTAGNLIHLGAHTILAVSDATYLVISLEGPKAIIYAITMPFHSKNDYSKGTVLNLEKLREEGATIKKVPASQEEIKKVLNSF